MLQQLYFGYFMYFLILWKFCGCKNAQNYHKVQYYVIAVIFNEINLIFNEYLYLYYLVKADLFSLSSKI